MRFHDLAFCLLIPCCVSIASAQSSTEHQLPFRISKETTYLTKPLAENGLVDFVAYLNQRDSKDVTAENNAAVLYFKAVGDGDEYTSQELVEKLKSALGTDPFTEGGPYLKLDDKLDDLLEANETYEQWNQQQEAAMGRPWKSSEHPIMTRSLEANRKPLEYVVQASQRERYYQPLIPTQTEFRLLTVENFPSNYRQVARLLKMRAMLALGEHRPQDAIRDLLALHRMARHVQQTSEVIGILVGWAIEQVAFSADQELANSPDMTVEQLIAYRLALTKLPELASARKLYESNRFGVLDIIQFLTLPSADGSILENDDLNGVLDLDIPEGVIGNLIKLFLHHGVDWNQVFIDTNQLFDRADVALSLDGYKAQFQAMQGLERKLEQELEKVNSPANLALLIFLTPEERGRQMSIIVNSSTGAILGGMVTSHTRRIARDRLSQIGLALAAFRKTTGRFPESLDALILEYLPALPLDPFTDHPFVYRVDEQGASIYSLGKNLKDDGGRTRDEDVIDYDLVFRVSK